MKISRHSIGPGHPPFIIAEMSGNHDQSLDVALRMVDAAANAGAHAIKLQTYTADTMTLDVDDDAFVIRDDNSLWKGQSLHALYEKAHTPWEWHKPVFERALQRGLVAFSTPFDATAVDFLETMNVPAYKIASFENTDIPLIRYVAGTGKPMIISTGMATLEELEESVSVARDAGCRDLILLKCTSTYPASPEHTNLRTIDHMRRHFHCEAGLSDHTRGIGVAVASIGMGATVIEKHFTLDRSAGGIDAAFSIEPLELEQLVTETHRAWEGLGGIRYGPTPAEMASLAYRRSLYVCADIKAGEILTTDNLKAIRPGHGLPPRELEKLLGRPVNQDLKKGTPMSWDYVSCP